MAFGSLCVRRLFWPCTVCVYWRKALKLTHSKEACTCIHLHRSLRFFSWFCVMNVTTVLATQTSEIKVSFLFVRPIRKSKSLMFVQFPWNQSEFSFPKDLVTSVFFLFFIFITSFIMHRVVSCSAKIAAPVTQHQGSSARERGGLMDLHRPSRSLV